MSLLLDTSVFIHDPTCLNRLAKETRVIIPIYVVMELDVLKDGTRKDKVNVAKQARIASANILKHMDESPEQVLVLSADQELDIKALDQASNVRFMDLLIVQCALNYQGRTEEKLKLLSKDVNLRILSRSVGIHSQDYISEVASFDNLYQGMRQIDLGHQLASALVTSYHQGAQRLTEEQYEIYSFIENEYVKCEINGKEHLFHYREGALSPVSKSLSRKVKPRNLEQRACLDLLLDPEITLVALLGKAGTGKTFLSLAAALEQSSRYHKILLSKPVVDVGHGIGFLPGSMKEKLEPWMQSFFDNLDQIDPMWDAEVYGDESNEMFLDKNNIEIQPIHSIRGRSLKDAFMIIDEAQNLTPHEIKSIVTRAAEGTKVVIMGDPYQIDSPYLDEKSNGLTHVIERMKGQDFFGCLTLHKSERSRMSDVCADLL